MPALTPPAILEGRGVFETPSSQLKRRTNLSGKLHGKTLISLSPTDAIGLRLRDRA
jgi:hypothetical protein